MELTKPVRSLKTNPSAITVVNCQASKFRGRGRARLVNNAGTTCIQEKHCPTVGVRPDENSSFNQHSHLDMFSDADCACIVEKNDLCTLCRAKSSDKENSVSPKPVRSRRAHFDAGMLSRINKQLQQGVVQQTKNNDSLSRLEEQKRKNLNDSSHSSSASPSSRISCLAASMPKLYLEIPTHAEMTSSVQCAALLRKQFQHADNDQRPRSYTDPLSRRHIKSSPHRHTQSPVNSHTELLSASHIDHLAHDHPEPTYNHTQPADRHTEPLASSHNEQSVPHSSTNSFTQSVTHSHLLNQKIKTENGSNRQQRRLGRGRPRPITTENISSLSQSVSPLSCTNTAQTTCLEHEQSHLTKDLLVNHSTIAIDGNKQHDEIPTTITHSNLLPVCTTHNSFSPEDVFADADMKSSNNRFCQIKEQTAVQSFSEIGKTHSESCKVSSGFPNTCTIQSSVAPQSLGFPNKVQSSVAPQSLKTGREDETVTGDGDIMDLLSPNHEFILDWAAAMETPTPDPSVESAPVWESSSH